MKQRTPVGITLMRRRTSGRVLVNLCAAWFTPAACPAPGTVDLAPWVAAIKRRQARRAKQGGK
jgi:hypothetical protein